MSVLTAVNNNKTKVLGIATTVLGFIQAYPGLRDMMTPTAFGWTMFVIGIGVAICGFLNSNPNTAPPSNRQGGFMLPRLLASLLLAASFGLVLVGVSGCTGTRAAYQEADTLPDRAYVALEQYFAVLKEWKTIVTNPATPEDVREALKAAELKATPVFLGDDTTTPPRPSIRKLASLYQATQNAQTATELQTAVNDAVRALTDFSDAVKAARSKP
jgi:hypothetical protein